MTQISHKKHNLLNNKVPHIFPPNEEEKRQSPTQTDPQNTSYSLPPSATVPVLRHQPFSEPVTSNFRTSQNTNKSQTRQWHVAQPQFLLKNRSQFSRSKSVNTSDRLSLIPQTITLPPHEEHTFPATPTPTPIYNSNLLEQNETTLNEELEQQQQQQQLAARLRLPKAHRG
eukprot:TRINITY_DN3014_c0_g1_i1.p1 TRINITY_DN3014_c0_g1~~TRINITY_DN3014_c0_g1_i1.p1  ORF type:complete len:171 (+),score=27.68 TRINITY_DN3014_c0_g1_i1:61-573(+)